MEWTIVLRIKDHRFSVTLLNPGPTVVNISKDGREIASTIWDGENFEPCGVALFGGLDDSEDAWSKIAEAVRERARLGAAVVEADEADEADEKARGLALLALMKFDEEHE